MEKTVFGSPLTQALAAAFYWAVTNAYEDTIKDFAGLTKSERHEAFLAAVSMLDSEDFDYIDGDDRA